MIHNIFPFHDELDLLELRLLEMGPYVDRFVLCEGVCTFSGIPKDLYFAKNRERYRQWWPKIAHYVCTDMHHGDGWAKERSQRNHLWYGMWGWPETDLVILSDADEIIRPEILQPEFLATVPSDGVTNLELSHRFYYFNVVGDGDPNCMSRLMTAGTMLRLGGPELAQKSPIDRVVHHAGWHMGYMGGVEGVSRKLKSFAHQEYADPFYSHEDNVAARMKALVDPVGRDNNHLAMMDDVPAHSHLFPEYIRHA